MGGDQEAEPSSIPVNTDLHSPHSSVATRRQRWRTISLLLGVPWCGSLVQGLAGGGYSLSVDPRRRKFNA
ncbi:hypothetical protein M405DRAFT_827935, partial [Rhizopogon salebrosus TDB-379]